MNTICSYNLALIVTKNVRCVLSLYARNMFIMTVSSVGVVFNIFNIYFLIRNREKIRFTELFSYLLILLACCDLLYLITGIGIFGLPAVSKWYQRHVIAKILPTWIGLAHIGRVGSVFVTCLLPLPIALAVLYNLPKFFEFVTCRDTSIQTLQVNTSIHNVTDKITHIHTQTSVNGNNLTHPDWENATLSFNDIQNLVKKAYFNRRNISKGIATNVELVDCAEGDYGVTPLRKNRWYIIFYVFWSDFIFVEMLPWIIVIMLNLLTWKGIRQFEKNRKRFMRTHSLVSGNNIFQQNKVLMGLVVVFVFCQCFTIVADVYELTCALGNSKNYNTHCPSNPGLLNVNNFISWGHFMLAVNSTVNFVFYMIHINEFRQAFLQSFCCCLSFCIKKNNCMKPRHSINQNGKIDENMPMEEINGIVVGS